MPMGYVLVNTLYNDWGMGMGGRRGEYEIGILPGHSMPASSL